MYLFYTRRCRDRLWCLEIFFFRIVWGSDKIFMFFSFSLFSLFRIIRKLCNILLQCTEKKGGGYWRGINVSLVCVLSNHVGDSFARSSETLGVYPGASEGRECLKTHFIQMRPVLIYIANLLACFQSAWVTYCFETGNAYLDSMMENHSCSYWKSVRHLIVCGSILSLLGIRVSANCKPIKLSLRFR